MSEDTDNSEGMVQHLRNGNSEDQKRGGNWRLWMKARHNDIGLGFSCSLTKIALLAAGPIVLPPPARDCVNTG